LAKQKLSETRAELVTSSFYKNKEQARKNEAKKINCHQTITLINEIGKSSKTKGKNFDEFAGVKKVNRG